MNEPSKIISTYKTNNDSMIAKLSRYSRLSVCKSENGNEYLETPNKVTIKKSNLDNYFAVSKGYENRIDLISSKFYNTPLLWWAICMANGISNPLDIPYGTLLRIPPISSIYDTGLINS